MRDERDEPYERIAAAIVCQALVDIGDPEHGESAVQFLLDDMWVEDRDRFPVLHFLPTLKQAEIKTLVKSMQNGTRPRMTEEWAVRLTGGQL